MTLRIFQILSLLIACLFFVTTNNTVGATGAASGSNEPESACDPEYMKSLKARAWMEVQREITKNQSIISKGDSVLDYTCFSNFAGHVGKAAGPLFSDNQKDFGAVPKSTTTLKALQDVVGPSTASYLQLDFGHGYIGGRSQQRSDRRPIEGSYYTCGEMAKVWNIAKCRNFQETANDKKTDAFDSFEDLKNKDTRELPNPCAGGQPTTLWDENIRYAKNEEDELYDYKKPLEETVSNISTLLTGGVCKTIYTGAQVVDATEKGEGTRDGFCLNPKCSFISKGSGDPECVMESSPASNEL